MRLSQSDLFDVCRAGGERYVQLPENKRERPYRPCD
jgi:hypothetical protein